MATQQRALLFEVVSGVEKLQGAVGWMGRVGGEGEEEGGRVLPAQGVLRRGLTRQAALLEAAGEGLGQVHVLAATVAGARKEETSSLSSFSSSSSSSVVLLPFLFSSWEQRLQALAVELRQALTNPILTHHDEALREEGVRLAAEATAKLSSCQATLATIAPPQVLVPVLAALVAVGRVERGREGGRTRTGGRKGVKVALEGVAEACLLSVQGLAAHRPLPPKKEKDDDDDEEEEEEEEEEKEKKIEEGGVEGKDEEEVTLLGALKQGMAETKGLKLSLLHARVRRLHAALLSSPDDLGENEEEEEELDAPMLLHVHRLLSLVLAGAGRVVGELIMGNKGTCKLTYICLRVFRSLLSQGLCGDGKEGEGEEGGEGGEGEEGGAGMAFEDDVEGTGMGQGQGKKDVTDELESEEQLLGTQNEQEEGEEGERRRRRRKKGKSWGRRSRSKGWRWMATLKGRCMSWRRGRRKRGRKRRRRRRTRRRS